MVIIIQVQSMAAVAMHIIFEMLNLIIFNNTLWEAMDSLSAASPNKLILRKLWIVKLGVKATRFQ